MNTPWIGIRWEVFRGQDDPESWIFVINIYQPLSMGQYHATAPNLGRWHECPIIIQGFDPTPSNPRFLSQNMGLVKTSNQAVEWHVFESVSKKPLMIIIANSPRQTTQVSGFKRVRPHVVPVVSCSLLALMLASGIGSTGGKIRQRSLSCRMPSPFFTLWPREVDKGHRAWNVLRDCHQLWLF